MDKRNGKWTKRKHKEIGRVLTEHGYFVNYLRAEETDECWYCESFLAVIRFSSPFVIFSRYGFGITLCLFWNNQNNRRSSHLKMLSASFLQSVVEGTPYKAVKRVHCSRTAPLGGSKVQRLIMPLSIV